MRMHFAWVGLAFGQMLACQRAVWFVLGCVEREQQVALRSLASLWLDAPAARSAQPPAALPAAESANDATFRRRRELAARSA